MAQFSVDKYTKKRELYLNPPVGFIGHRGFEKFIKDLPNWKTEFSKNDYDKLLTNMVQFFGTVPTVPNALRGISEPDTMEFGGGFDKVSVMLSWLGTEHNNAAMTEAAEIFGRGATVTTKIKEIIVDYLTDRHDGTDKLPALFTQVACVMKNGFEMLK